MTWDIIIAEIQNKWVLDIGRKEGQQDQNIADRLTRFEAYRVSI